MRLEDDCNSILCAKGVKWVLQYESRWASTSRRRVRLRPEYEYCNHTRSKNPLSSWCTPYFLYRKYRFLPFFQFTTASVFWFFFLLDRGRTRLRGPGLCETNLCETKLFSHENIFVSISRFPGQNCSRILFVRVRDIFRIRPPAPLLQYNLTRCLHFFLRK